MSEEMKLKPCPFCGEIPEVDEYFSPPPEIILSCKNNKCTVSPRVTIQVKTFPNPDGTTFRPLFKESMPDLIKLWNTRSPEPRQGVDWEQEYSDAFRVAYKGILSDEIIEGSIAWNVDFIKRHVRFTLPAEVRWPELKEAFGQNTFKDGLCHGYNRAVNDCKQALDKILLDNGLQRN